MRTWDHTTLPSLVVSVGFLSNDTVQDGDFKMEDTTFIMSC